MTNRYANLPCEENIHLNKNIKKAKKKEKEK
jgi:hypothetical protein